MGWMPPYITDPMEIPNNPKFMRPRQIKERYAVGISTLYRWLANGLISGSSKPGMTLIEVASVERYMSTWKRKGE